MKKLLFIAMIIASVSAKAQTFYNTKVAFAADASGVEFDFTDSLYNWNGCILEVLKENSNGTYSSILDFAEVFDQQSGSLSVPTTLANLPTIETGISSYPIEFGKKYMVHYQLPSSFRFKYMCHNPYSSFSIRIYGADYSNTVIGSWTIAEVPFSTILHPGEYWECFGNRDYEVYDWYGWFQQTFNSISVFASYGDSPDEIAAALANVTQYFIGISFTMSF